MRTRITVAVVVVLLCAAVAAAQRATFTPVSGVAHLVGADSSGATITCIGGEPTTGVPWPLCTPGSKVQIRRLILTYLTIGFDPEGSLVTGTRTLVFNYEHVAQDKDARVWGTFRLVLDGNGGVWEGTFAGTLAGTIVSHGTEGTVEGMHFVGAYSYDNGFPGLETFSGYVIDTNAKK